MGQAPPPPLKSSLGPPGGRRPLLWPLSPGGGGGTLTAPPLAPGGGGRGHRSPLISSSCLKPDWCVSWGCPDQMPQTGRPEQRLEQRLSFSEVRRREVWAGWAPSRVLRKSGSPVSPASAGGWQSWSSLAWSCTPSVCLVTTRHPSPGVRDPGHIGSEPILTECDLVCAHYVCRAPVDE